MGVKEELIGKRFPVLDSGAVTLIDCMGDDRAIVAAARVSVGDAKRKLSEDRDLIRFLMRRGHSSPFEQCSVKLAIRAPIYVWRQIERHRTGRMTEAQCALDDPSVNERSQRYAEAIDAMQVTPSDEWRKQSEGNKQGSEGAVTEWPDEYEFRDGTVYRHWPGAPPIVEAEGLSGDVGEYLTFREFQTLFVAREAYQERLRFGVAREQARKDLPLSTYTEAFVAFDLRNLLHFLGLRLAPDAQKEIREYAIVISYEIINPLFPITWEAWSDYVLNAVTLSRLDIEAVCKAAVSDDAGPPIFDHIANKRERQESIEKLKRLGLITHDWSLES